jgi:hypothetical protein
LSGFGYELVVAASVAFLRRADFFDLSVSA